MTASDDSSKTASVLDLRKTKCPLNFVKAKLAAEKLQPGETLEIWLVTEGDSAVNVPNSLRQEGYRVEHQQEAAVLKLFVERAY